MNSKVNLDIRTEIELGDRPQGAELQAADIDRQISHDEGWGVVLEGDVGKRVWLRSWGIVMENLEQRDARRAKSA